MFDLKDEQFYTDSTHTKDSILSEGKKCVISTLIGLISIEQNLQTL